MNTIQMIVKRHQEKAARMAAQQVDWEKRREKWLEVLEQLLNYLRQAFSNAGVPEEQIVRTHHQITEELLGDYTAPGLEVTIGQDIVAFVPIASVIIGGCGRVDVTGPRGQVKLIVDTMQSMSEEESSAPSYSFQWAWSVYPDRSHRGGYPLDEEGLAKVLEAVLGGA